MALSGSAGGTYHARLLIFINTRLILSSSNIEIIDSRTFSNLALLFSVDLKVDHDKKLASLIHMRTFTGVGQWLVSGL